MNTETTFITKMKLYCEEHIGDDKDVIKLYNTLGGKKCKALSYQRSRIMIEINARIKLSKLTEVVKDYFKVGMKYTNTDTKKTFALIYEKEGVNKRAKATSIKLFADVKRATLLVDGKRKEGLEIIKYIQ